MKNFSNSRLLFLCFISIFQSSCFAYIENVFIDKKDGSAVVCLGERHQSWYRLGGCGPDSEERDKGCLLNLVENLSKSPVSVRFLLESQLKNMNKFCALQYDVGPLRPGCLSTLSAYAARRNNQHGSIQFVWADNRGPVNMAINEAFAFFSNPEFYRLFCVRYLTTFSQVLDELASSRPSVAQALQVLSKKGNTDSFDQLLDAVPELRGPFFSERGIFDSLRASCRERLPVHTGQELLSEIDRNIENIAALVEQHANNEPLKTTFQGYCTRLTNVRAHAHAFFKGLGGLDVSCADSAFKAAKKRTFGYVRDQIYLWLIPLGGVVADAHFVDELVQGQQQGHNVIFYGGANHAIELHDVCQKLNMVNTCRQGRLEKDDKPGIVISTSSQFCSSRIEGIMQAVIAAVMKEPKSPVLTSSIVRTCSFCKKQGNAFKRCSACQAVYYCSGDCQRNDWPQHKTICSIKTV